ncbi:mechanosensitive ion channel domain-containing protein [Oceanicoccus sp. KOV_DT_Chl]|uniref:mechanosensitive ion channel domain-containing protein n=1 Tax=Oceanicoccus sp. KOV_DT_Chl TaxID=1904639 RepID=UPI000C7A1639|nr:mechanosensitive ion channel domain-containing protein [Oceanicoccus sp. KOV_DT_Chl]
MTELEWLLPSLSTSKWLAHFTIFIINFALFFLAKPVLNITEHGQDIDSKNKTFQFISILILGTQILDILVLRVSSDYESYFINIGLSLLSLYSALFSYSIFTYFSRKRFGHEKSIDDKTLYLDTYSTRIVNILFFAIVVFSTIYALIIIWGANSLLETTGIFGIIAAFLAFTSSIWAPDIISGLIILNSQMLEDGDVVVIEGYKDEYIINKVSLIYIILYDVRNNHRTLIRNNRFIQSKIDNLSRIASTEGVRQSITFNIGYPTIEDLPAEEREQALSAFKTKIDNMFKKAYENCLENTAIKINNNKVFDWAITNAGDYALEYTLWIYLERIPNTKVTSTIRKHIVSTRLKVNEAVYTSAVMSGIKLATPSLEKIELVTTG